MNRDSSPSQTEIEYRQVIAHCKALFDKKNKDYGTSWRILRLPSLTDQIFIKAQRIRSIQDKGLQKRVLETDHGESHLDLTKKWLNGTIPGN